VFTAQKTLKETRIKLHSTLTIPALLCCSENWTNKARDARRITAAGMKCMRETAGKTWEGHTVSTEIAVLDKVQEYKKKWLKHMNRMSRN